MRIAEAVRKRVAAAKTPRLDRQGEARRRHERKMMDSIIAANRRRGVASVGAPRRLVITEPPAVSRQWPEAALLGRAVADSLAAHAARPRPTIHARGPRFGALGTHDGRATSAN